MFSYSFCTAHLNACKGAQCWMARERVDVDVGRCQRHTGAYRTISASVQSVAVWCLIQVCGGLSNLCGVDLAFML